MVFREGRGHIVFGVDLVHISISVRIAYCLHSVFCMEGWILIKLIQIHHWVGERADYIFVALFPFSRSH